MDAQAIVVGSGPNGLAAAIALAEAGRSVTVLEAQETIGGGLRSTELTLPGVVHDVCSAVHPLATASPFLSRLPLADHGLEWLHPTPCAHPLDDGTAAVLERGLDATADSLGRDGDAYRRLIGPLAESAADLLPTLLGPPMRIPRHPLALARFGLPGFVSAAALARRRFEGDHARALFAGLAAHAILPLERRITAGVGLMFALVAHHSGWPIPRGGAQRIADAMTAHLRALGGEVVAGRAVDDVAELDGAKAVLLDLTPREVVRVAGDRLPARYVRRLSRWRYGPGVFKLDLVLDGPVPWTASGCAAAGTVHLGGTLEEIAESERAVSRGEHPERPFVLLSQPSVVDPTRAPSGRHVIWAYCHVPNGSSQDMTAAIEAQIERFAPGFGERVVARHRMGPAEVEARNANHVGGEIGGGIQDLRGYLARPAPRISPHTTPDPRLYLCSSSTPPGAGVHGMCGWHAAAAALRRAPW
jgi:phytoene dehydrogenase-like protein